MKPEEIIGYVDGLDGVLTVQPSEGDGTPELAWGDTFFYYAPDGVMPTNTQPFATIVTKNYPGDELSRLDRPDVFRVNIAAGKDNFVKWTGHAPRDTPAGEVDYSAFDTLMPHPVYGTVGWLAVVNPGPRTEADTRELLHTACELARARYERRNG
ncbi:DUF6194 family protein [Amycolatopsis albispora]|uniref:DUF6194 domain-containing protein n=1 Tax=Amycolatopsis albispora TaxID=1804986 RepID=A0A344L497_9PSEU|nr:DUF6194 family protein [Amycolatopsis albispora]AXB42871.1 hypothetical protein A4R43_10250 [Amycolatopsis albispora]